VVIRYDAPLMQPHTQAILATRQFDIHKAVAGKAVPQMLVAFGQTADALAAQVVDWVNSARSGERSSWTTDPLPSLFSAAHADASPLSRSVRRLVASLTGEQPLAHLLGHLFGASTFSQQMHIR
jgi:hypothetical protein